MEKHTVALTAQGTMSLSAVSCAYKNAAMQEALDAGILF